MELTQIEHYLKENAYPFYREEANDFDHIMQDKVFLALLHSLSLETISELSEYLKADRDCPSTLYFKTLGVIKYNRRAQMAKSVDTETCLRWFKDKKGGKVSVAYKELVTRYRYENSEYQQAILTAFLMEGGKKQLEWAARHLRDHWICAMAPQVKQRWTQTHNPILGIVVLKHLPDAFVKEEQDSLAAATKYAYVCVRLGNTEGFIVDTTRLSFPDYLYVSAKLGWGRDRDFSLVVDAIMNEYLDDNSRIAPMDLSIILWSLGQLGLTELIIHYAPEFKKRIANHYIY